MLFKLLEFLSIMLSALVGGLYWGPWLALSRTLKVFEPIIFLAVVNQMNRNMSFLMTILTPLALLSIIPTMIMSYQINAIKFYLISIGFIMFLAALLVTVLIEVPLVKQMIEWKIDKLPSKWEQIRDKWVKFHIARVLSAVFGLAFLISALL